MDQNLILESIQKLSLRLDCLSDSVKLPETRSSDLKELFTALAKAQSEMEIAGKRSKNPFFKSKYADLAEIVRASRVYLSKYGLSVIQQILPNNDGHSILHTILAHSSGEWISSQMKIVPQKSDIQALGSYITFLRRYSYAALVGIVTSDDDDDGEMAVSHEQFPRTIKEVSKEEKVSADQLDELQYELMDHPDIAEEVLDKMKISRLSELPKAKFRASIERIREIKNIRNNIK